MHQRSANPTRVVGLTVEPGIRATLARRPFARNALAGALALVLAGAAGGFTGDLLAATTTTDPASPVATGPHSFADVVERVTPAVVNVTVAQDPGQRLSPPHGNMPQGIVPEDSPLYPFFQRFGNMHGMPMPKERQGEGSGFIVDADGHIVTNNHVVEDATRIEVTLNDGTKHEARVIGRDPKTDIALIKIDADRPLPFVQPGSSKGARVGDWVLAVGNPFGLGGTVNAGIVSARGRDIQSGPYDDYLQIDAPINRGNSGGPLFDTTGQVIGVNTAIYSPSGGNVGIGFAIPAETVADVVAQLRDTGHVERGWLGVQIQPVTEAVAESLGLPNDSGVLVADVLPGGPAEAAGVRSGDVILTAAGQHMQDYRDLTRLIAGIDAGTRVDLELIREGKPQHVAVTIGHMPQDEVAQAAPTSVDDGQPRIGLYLAPLTPEMRAERGLPSDSEGVVVAQVQEGSPAARAGIEPGSVISMVGQQRVQSPDEVVALVRKAAEQDRRSVLLRVEQDGEQRFVAVPFA